jgi:hypothetical protein
VLLSTVYIDVKSERGIARGKGGEMVRLKSTVTWLHIPKSSLIYKSIVGTSLTFLEDGNMLPKHEGMEGSCDSTNLLTNIVCIFIFLV